MIYFDNGVNPRAYDNVKLQMAVYYYNRAAKWGKGVTIATKGSAYLAGSVLDFEKAGRGPKDILFGAWQTDDQIGSSWGYTTDMRYHSAASVVSELAVTVSKGGNLLLNVSPKADGTIPDAQQQILLDVGRWLGVNGEAVYGSRPWTKFGDGAFRFTTNNASLYAIGIGRASATAVIPSLASGTARKIQGVTLLGRPGPLTFTQGTDALSVTMPKTTDALAPVLKIVWA